MQQNVTGCHTGDARRLLLPPPQSRSDRQRRAIALLLQGCDESHIAHQIQVNRTTLWRWKQDPHFRDELAAHRRSHDAASADRLGALRDPNADFLECQVNDSKTALRAFSILRRLCPS